MADRTGGMRGGVFRSAVDNVNRLQPDIVLSVGDLVDGYTTDSTYLHEQWSEFNDIIQKLTLPFFYLPGNHDISNEWMRTEWERRFGRSYYYFVYKDVLFLMLNTEPDSRIDAAQINYFTRILKKYHDVTDLLSCIVPHRHQKGGYDALEEVLAGRDYTVYSGHHHHYLKAERHGRRHYVLGTTGGGSAGRAANDRERLITSCG
ncbi:MAG: metallophosphoesterase [candidate division KSB1 bacterium]|nr:metallophosphoesterase [candidate division KSB1 bacterium]